jgi:putative transposase
MGLILCILIFMPRIARIVIPGVPHHITQRGNNRQDVFFVDEDRIIFLRFLKEQSQKFGMRIDGYCLMTNHIHIIATPGKEDSFAKAMGRTNLLYTQYINFMHGRGGHMWQNRYFSCPLGPDYFFKALCYIEQNPVRAKLSRYPWTYRWSSASVHTGRLDEFGMIDKSLWAKRSSGIDWRQVLKDKTESSEIGVSLGVYCRTGRPLGTDKFISKLEVKLGRRLRPLPIGRPKKKTTKVKNKPMKQNEANTNR